MGKFNYSISSSITVSNFVTTEVFNSNFVHSNKSAIDDFIDKRKALFTLLNPYKEDISKTPDELMNMILLGCISAVESYVRKIIRSLIIVDEHSRKACESQTLKYGAVIFHDKSMLPEALLEEYSFAGGKNIKDTIKNLTGISISKQNSSLNESFAEYSKICQLRHCVVHRFGFLGSNNAIKLGLTEHVNYLEKPLQINFDNLNEIVQICENVVKVLNDFLFCEVLERTFSQRTENWSYDYRRDRKIFKKYFNVFCDSTVDHDEKKICKDFLSSMKEHYGGNYL